MNKEEAAARDAAWVALQGLYSNGTATLVKMFEQGAEYQRQQSAARIGELEAALESAIESGCDKILAMTDEQISALNRMEGHDPDDAARIGKQVYELAKASVRIAELEDENLYHSRLIKEYKENTDTLLSELASLKNAAALSRNL